MRLVAPHAGKLLQSASVRADSDKADDIAELHAVRSGDKARGRTLVLACPQ
jgi:hypothetical protein